MRRLHVLDFGVGGNRHASFGEAEGGSGLGHVGEGWPDCSYEKRVGALAERVLVASGTQSQGRLARYLENAGELGVSKWDMLGSGVHQRRCDIPERS